MQLPRVVIAAVFFVIGALIAIPALMETGTSKAASKAPISPTATASPRPTPTPTPTKASPTPSPTPSVPVTAGIGQVRCPGRTVQVTVTNRGGKTEDYTVLVNGSVTIADRVGPQASRRSTVTIKEDATTTVTASWQNRPIRSVRRKANCSHKSGGQTLPHTGPDDAGLFAKAATGGAAMLTGVIIFWYGCIWPRRREVFGSIERSR